MTNTKLSFMAVASRLSVFIELARSRVIELREPHIHTHAVYYHQAYVQYHEVLAWLQSQLRDDTRRPAEPEWVGKLQATRVAADFSAAEQATGTAQSQIGKRGLWAWLPWAWLPSPVRAQFAEILRE